MYEYRTSTGCGYARAKRSQVERSGAEPRSVRNATREAYEDRGVAGEETLASAPSLRGGALLSRVELLARAQLALLQRALAERHLRHAALVPAPVH